VLEGVIDEHALARLTARRGERQLEHPWVGLVAPTW
jgi:hypothetical protein